MAKSGQHVSEGFWTETLTRTLTDRLPTGTTLGSIVEILSGPHVEADTLYPIFR